MGKTSIVQRFVYDTFNPSTDRTIGFVPLYIVLLFELL